MYALGSEHDSTVNVNEHDSTVKHTAAADTDDTRAVRGPRGVRGGVSSRVSSSRCMQVLTTAPSHNLRTLHASAHHGATSCVPHARPACNCSPRRPTQNLRALPRASSSTSCGQRRRSVASSRSNVPRAPDEMQSDAIRCNQMPSSEAIRATQSQSERIRGHPTCGARR